ncbi:MAG TPA: lysyl oxidase family protein [Polyangia bacterium]|nr:lysyl oxidase family protein [Polyangia bacterium]
MLAVCLAACSPPPDDDGGSGTEIVEAAATLTFPEKPPAPWKTASIGNNGALPGLISYDSTTSTILIESAGSNVSGTKDGLAFAYQPLTGDGQIIARVSGFANFPKSSSRLGLMVRTSTAADAPYFYLYQKKDRSIGISLRTPGSPGSDDPLADPVPQAVWLKVVRRGDQVGAAYSYDGKVWEQRFAAVSSSFAQSTLLVGLAAASYDTTKRSQSYFDTVSVAALPPPFQSLDITRRGLLDPDKPAPGSASYDFFAQTFTVKGAGGSEPFLNTERLVHRPLLGDGEIVARIDQVTAPGDEGGLGGITIRSALRWGAPELSIFATSSAGDGISVQLTDGSGATLLVTGELGPWVKLIRTGSMVDAQSSTDGVVWTSLVKQSLASLGPTAFAGMFSSSTHDPHLLATSVFSNVAVTPVRPERDDLVVTVVPKKAVKQSFAVDSADVKAGCVTAGTHAVVRFDTIVENRGSTALVLGDPARRPDLFSKAKLTGFENVTLRNAAQAILARRTVPFCFEDTVATQLGAPPKAFDCSHQGISPGWTSQYQSTRTCAFFVADGLKSGAYDIHLEMNANRAVLEDDYGNDSTTVPFTLTAP